MLNLRTGIICVFDYGSPVPDIEQGAIICGKRSNISGESQVYSSWKQNHA